jgi:dephospho-CoA kinase
MAFRFFGLTGGLASGKSTVAARFRELGVPVVDADDVAREVVAPGSPGLAQVVEVFGAEVLRSDGTLDRALLASRVFGDDEARRRLNGILHPRIGLRTAERAAELAASGVPLACYEATLLVENGLVEAFRPLVVVVASEAAQIARAVTRDGATEEHVRARLAAQMPLAEKAAQADYVIDNAGSRDELLARSDAVLGLIRARFGGG